MRNRMVRVFCITFLVIVAGCSQSMKDIKNKTIENVKETFHSTNEEANEESNQFSFYLPYGMSVQEDSTNNIIMKYKRDHYILFYNQNEKQASEVVYKMSVPEKNVIIKETFHKDNQFGYLIVFKVKKDLYEVITGIGGIKMTTESKIGNITKNAEKMMKIVKSVQYKK